MAPSARWFQHALDSLKDRGIDSLEAERTLAAPAFIVIQRLHRSIRMRRYLDHVLDQLMLIRLVVGHTPDGRVVVTVYKTSRIYKYLRGFST